MRGHSSSFYIDIGCIALGLFLATFGDWVTGTVLIGIGVGIHFLMGE